MSDDRKAAPSPASQPDARPLREWLRQFALAVRGADYAAGRRLFAPDVFSFGTVNQVLNGLDQLETRQWRQVWDVTRGFDFDDATVRLHVDNQLACVMALWRSEGQSPDGWFTRHGRATFVLEHRGGSWLAVHSHVSMDPPPR